MSRQQGTKIQNKFVRGLITEATVLSFPEDACTDTSNCVFDHTGKVTRRPGFDTEESYTTDTLSVSAGDAYTTFLWEAVSGDGNISFYVVQSEGKIKFYDVSSSTDISTNKLSTELTLTDYLVTNSNEDPSPEECQYAVGNGDLFIVNRYINPIYVSYDVASEIITATTITLMYRDFAGLSDGLDDNERVTSSVSGAETNYPNHLYNLYNQGWAGTDALSQWDTARTDIPSNVDYITLYRSSETDSFDNTKVTSQDPGNRLAPRGHFLLSVAEDDRDTALSDAGFSFLTSQTTVSLIDRTAGSSFDDFDSNASAAFDGDLSETTTTAATKNGTTAYMGKDYGASVIKQINRAIIYPSSNSGFFDENESATFTLYGNTSTPASGTDGTSLGSEAIVADQITPLTITSSDTTTAYRYVWVYASGFNDDIYYSEVQFYAAGTFSFERPTVVEFYSGRVFYGGINVEGLSNNIYFSQIIEDEGQYGKCYQKNDPTSEEFSDLLSDDGGVIKIPEMGTLYRMYAYQNALILFASNGVWLVSGSAGSTFKATDYQVKKISSIGMNSPQSVISIRGLPAWFGEDGIYTVQFDANYDSFTPQSLTFQSIDTFYQDIPLFNKRYAKGAYDNIEQIAYWIYSSDTDLGTDVYRYDSILCLDGRTQAFYTWDITSGPLVRSIDYVKSADRQGTSKLKFMIHQNYNGSSADQTFAEVLNTNYIDWENEGTSADYSSYFVTGYSFDGQTQRFFQPNYIFVFLDQETNASCFVQGIFDTATSVGTGKWSTSQQIYNENLLNRDLNFRRLKIRGKGRSLQLRFESEDQKPFSILGWSIWETVNTGV